MMALEGKEGVTETNSECCMCGDYGLERELFHCRVCGFRSQHRYCSNLYPKVELYKVMICNWCLKKEEETHNSSSSTSSSSHGNKAAAILTDSSDRGNTHLNLKAQKSNNPNSQFHQMINKPIKKQKSPDRSLCRKKTAFSNRMPKFSGISQTRMTKKVFRGRIPRYKLLEEVCR